MRAALVLMVVLMAFSIPVLADPPVTTLRIEVKTLAGTPVDRASVIVRFLGARDYLKLGRKIRTSWETRTNMDGVARIPSLPQGKLLIQVIAKGYQTFGQQYEISEPDKTIEIKLNPPQPQYSVHD
jgi:hypothetical protein